MKATHFLAIGTFFLAVLLTACNPQEQALNDLQEFTEHLEQGSANFSPSEWDQAILQYDEICRAIAECDAEYTRTEQEVIGRLKGRCQVIFSRHALEDGLGGFMRNLYQYKGLFEGVLEGLNESLEEFQNQSNY